MNRTKIEWCDYTWNPITGCSAISEGCAHCYAETLSRRFGWTWGQAVFHAKRLGDPMSAKRPSRIFVCSMGDFFHESVCPGWQVAVQEVMARCLRHTFLILTKRPDTEMIEDSDRSNIWWGVTTENQARFDERWITLAKSSAGTAFISAEPLLGPIDLTGAMPDWVIAGPETGPGARPCNPAWIESLAAQCRAAGIPFFDKRPGGPCGREWPDERGES